jgi:hypothetical protein
MPRASVLEDVMKSSSDLSFASFLFLVHTVPGADGAKRPVGPMGYFVIIKIVEIPGFKKQFLADQKVPFQFVPKTVAPYVGGKNISR